MPYCSRCGFKYNDSSKFCEACGAPTDAAQEVQQTPVNTAPVNNTYTANNTYSANNTYTNPYTYEPPQVSGSAKALGIVGMILGIFGLVMATTGLMTVLSCGDWDYGLAFGYSIGFGIFSFPCSLVGKILSSKSMDAGNTSGTCRAGSVTGLIGIILSALMLFIGILTLSMY